MKNCSYCSFCGRSQQEVNFLVSGRGIFICDRCVVICQETIDKAIKEDAKKEP